MKLLFKQRFFSWFDSYDIYDETGAAVYTVEGKLSFGHHLEIHDAMGNEVATLQEKVLTFLPKFEIYLEDTMWAASERSSPSCAPGSPWTATDGMWRGGSWSGTTGFWTAAAGWWPPSPRRPHWTDTYVIDVERPEDGAAVADGGAGH